MIIRQESDRHVDEESNNSVCMQNTWYSVDNSTIVTPKSKQIQGKSRKGGQESKIGGKIIVMLILSFNAEGITNKLEKNNVILRTLSTQHYIY